MLKMVRNKEKILILLIITILLLYIRPYITEFYNWLINNIIDNKNGNDYFSGSMTVVAAIIAVSGVYFTIKHNNEIKRKEILDNLDSKSEWRKQLYDVASKTFLTTDDVYRVIASLRYLPKGDEEIKKSKQKYFDYATSVIFEKLYTYIYETDSLFKQTQGDCNNTNHKAFYISFQKGEIVKLYIKYLLKHHWEYNKGDWKKYHKKEEERDFCMTQKQVEYIEKNGIKEYIKIMTNLSSNRGCLGLLKCGRNKFLM